MPIDKPNRRGPQRRSAGRRMGPQRKRRTRNPRHQRSEAEQLDYEMELMKAQREGREADFKAQARVELRKKRQEALDKEMDDYFANKPTVEQEPEKPAEEAK